MKQDQQEMIAGLKAILLSCRDKVRSFKQEDAAALNQKPSPAGWSVLECMEHLNLYGDFYLPEMEKSLLAAGPATGKQFRSGLLGGYFAKLMKVGPDGRMTKMKTPGDKNPANSELGTTVLDRFLKQQDMLLSLLERSARVDLRKATVPITLTRWIRLSLGDTFRFNVFHIERHVFQAERALRAALAPGAKLQPA